MPHLLKIWKMSTLQPSTHASTPCLVLSQQNFSPFFCHIATQEEHTWYGHNQQPKTNTLSKKNDLATLALRDFSVKNGQEKKEKKHTKPKPLITCI